MAVKRLRPVTPGQRFKISVDLSGLSKEGPEKSLLAPIKKSGGRNNDGKMTMRYIGGGHKRKYRIIDFKRDKAGKAEVLSLEYDPNRTCFIALVKFSDSEKRYILAPHGLKVGQFVENGSGIAPELGNALPLSDMPLGSIINNIIWG